MASVFNIFEERKNLQYSRGKYKHLMNLLPIQGFGAKVRRGNKENEKINFWKIT